MNWSTDGFTLAEYLLIVEQAYNSAYGNGNGALKWHPEDLSTNLEVVNKIVSESLSNAWEKWCDKK